MRHVIPAQRQLGETDIAQIQFNPKSRDDIPPLLRGLQHLYVTPALREEVFAILEEVIPKAVDRGMGRPGMGLWKILVLGTLRLNLNWDYDRLQEMANHHKTIRQMLGHGLVDDEATYELQTLKDNVALLSPEVLDRINQVVVKAGHAVLKKKDEPLTGRCDSFVVETHVHYPTDTTVLWDALRKVITLIAVLCGRFGLTEWRQSRHVLRQVKKLLRQVQRRKRSTSQDPLKQAQREQAIREAHQAYVDRARALLARVAVTLETLQTQCALSLRDLAGLAEVESFIAHAERQIDQIERRVLHGESIPHEEKVFSVFEPHTEWLSKGKAGVPVELGLNVCVLEDQHGFILHHQVMVKQTDEAVAVAMVAEAQARFPTLRACSFDTGFYTPKNRTELEQRLALVVMPKKGKRSAAEQEWETSEPVVQLRRQHAAVESAINALEVHGLDRCPDHGLDGFQRYVALAVVARNIQQLGVLLRKQEAASRKRRSRQAA